MPQDVQDQNKEDEIADDKLISKNTNPLISKYYQKQFERFMQSREKKEDIHEAFFQSIPGEQYEDTLYTRLKRNPRRGLPRH